jgi:solute:Na+ symporter, SSS family
VILPKFLSFAQMLCARHSSFATFGRRITFCCAIQNFRLKRLFMHWIDWTILLGSLIFVTAYGMLKTRGTTDMQTYLLGNKELKWWTIGLSIMATQASAITFLSTTGQGYDDGMRFAQFYIGMPVAMVILSIFFIPIYYKLNVLTAYEFLERRFDLRIRTFTALLFLVQRGMAAGLTIAAPAIVLSTLLGWDWVTTNLMLGTFVILYTVFGGGEAVSVTQQQQMIIILVGMLIAFLVMLFKLPSHVSFSDAMSVSGSLGKLKAIDFSFDIKNKYTFWSGMLGGFFLFLSYFGTDQSQVQRYLSGKSLTESKLGLLFNGLVKVPMQFLVLLVGVMMFVFYQFNQAPIHFNEKNLVMLENSPNYGSQLGTFQSQYNQVFSNKKTELNNLVQAIQTQDEAGKQVAVEKINVFRKEEKQLRDSVRQLISKAEPGTETKDRDYTFINFVMNNLPVGIIGLLLACIFAAAMSSTSSELNALATTTMVDIYRRQVNPNQPDAHYMHLSKWFTAAWGVVVLFFAIFSSFFTNLIEAVNIIGSLFYGTILGIFMVAFFQKRIGGKAVFTSALIAEAVVILVYARWGWKQDDFPFLWLNPLGCLLVMFLATIFQFAFFRNEKVKIIEQLD